MTTKTAQFTPGPWREYHTHGNWEMYGSNGQLLFRIKDGVIPMLNDTALIAAAPAMYEALSHAAMSYHHPACKCKGEYSANPELYCTCHVQKARAALAQAEGR